jgi:hypothetical protein
MQRRHCLQGIALSHGAVVEGTATADRNAHRLSAPSGQRTGGRRTASDALAAGWLIAALAFTLFLTWRAMAFALLRSDVVQDDMRQWAVWLLRLRDPELFQGDLISQYYESTAPPGYTALYWLLSRAVDPLAASKLLPPLLGLSASVFTFLLVRVLHPAPTAAFLATVLLSWYSWQHGDLASATPRAFALPLLAAVLWALVSGRARLVAGLVVLAGGLYPVVGALGLAVLGLRLVQFSGWRARLTRQWSPWLRLLAVAIPTAGLLLPTQLASARFGPIATAAEAQANPEFGPGGRFSLFGDGLYHYWVGSLEGGLPVRLTDAVFPQVPILAECALLAALLPLLMLKGRVPGIERLSKKSVVLVELLSASLALFVLAHLLLYRLYAPSRYLKWTLPLVLCVAAGIALGILLEALARHRGVRRGLLAGGLALALGLFLAIYPANNSAGFVQEPRPAVMAYLRTLPKETVVAGVPFETDSVPAFAGRRVLASREHMLPFHLGYYGELQRRMLDLIEAYYSESVAEVAVFAARHEVDVLLVNRTAFDPRRARAAWASGGPWEPYTSTAWHQLDQGSRRFVLPRLAERCAVVDDGQVAAVPVHSLTASPEALQSETWLEKSACSQ